MLGRPSTLTVRRRPVELVRRVPVPLDAAVDVLRYGADRLVALDPAMPWEADGGLSSLAVDLPGGIHLTRQVRIGFGPILEEDGTFAVPVWWEAEEYPHLFPTFDGALEVCRGRGRGGEGTDLHLVGSYQPPLGSIGRFANGFLGHQVVMASLEELLNRMADRLATTATDMAAVPAGLFF
ncbi:MAG TPA: hypothetical protein VKA30_13000 [Actinomycetota bacterium]|nr:hypothetical protein [Actinomycetota bacterium]